MWRDDPRPASVLVSGWSVPGLSSRHEQLWSHRSDRGERRLEDQHGLCGPPQSCHRGGTQLSDARSPLKHAPDLILRMYVIAVFSVEIQPKNL